MNKKAAFNIAGEMWMLVVRLFFLIAVAFAVFTIISIGVNKTFEFGNVENEVIFNAIYMSDCINYKDVRTYPGVIDFEKFNQSDLDGCFKSKRFGSRISLKLDGNTIEKFIDKKFFDIESRFCPFKQYRCSEKNIHVIVKEKGDFKVGELVIESVFKNE
ncbi:MAG: hypothetical protein AABX90_02510 [Nanoarchaeota archaeon]